MVRISSQGAYSDSYSTWGRLRGSGESSGAGQSRATAGRSATGASQSSSSDGAEDATAKSPSISSAADTQQLTAEEQAEVAKLKSRDTEVRAHEQAHIAVGGQYVRGGASFDYDTGPDGRKYAVGGEVSIDTSSVPDDPRATVLKMETVKRAALAPAQPSTQDRSVAATADRTATQARMAIATKALEEQQALAEGNPPAKGTLVAFTV